MVSSARRAQQGGAGGRFVLTSRVGLIGALVCSMPKSDSRWLTNVLAAVIVPAFSSRLAPPSFLPLPPLLLSHQTPLSPHPLPPPTRSRIPHKHQNNKTQASRSPTSRRSTRRLRSSRTPTRASRRPTSCCRAARRASPAARARPSSSTGPTARTVRCFPPCTVFVLRRGGRDERRGDVRAVRQGVMRCTGSVRADGGQHTQRGGGSKQPQRRLPPLQQTAAAASNTQPAISFPCRSGAPRASALRSLAHIRPHQHHHHTPIY